VVNATPKIENLAFPHRLATLSYVSNSIMPQTADMPGPFEPPHAPEPEILSPDTPHWSSWTAIGALLLSIVLILITPLLFLAPYVVGSGVGFEDQQKLQEFLFSDRTAIILQLAPIVLAHALTLAAAWAVVTNFNTYSFRDALGWQMNGFRWWYSFPITFFFIVLAGGLTYVFGDVENSFEQLLKRSREAVYLTAFFATFTAPLVEEVVYRGLLYSAFQRRLGMARAVALVTLIFTAVHVPQYSLGARPDLAPLVALLLLSLTLTLIRAWTKNLLPCIVLHTVFNGFGSVLLIAQSHFNLGETVEDPISAAFFIFK
jgi:uncharacterized protein